MKNARLIGYQIRLNIEPALSFKLSFILQVLCMIISNVAFVIFWYILFDNANGTIGNYVFSDVMYLWGITSIGYGLCFLCCAGVSQIGMKILDGSLDTYILQPCPTIIGVIFSSSNVSAIGDILYGIVLILLTQKITGYLMLITVLSSVTAAMVIHALLLIWNSLVFFFGNIIGCSFMSLDLLITLSTYPAEIFNDFVKAIMLSIIPAYFVSHIPLMAINQHFPIFLLIPLGFALVSNIVGICLFKLGLRRYSSSSFITTRS